MKRDLRLPPEPGSAARPRPRSNVDRQAIPKCVCGHRILRHEPIGDKEELNNDPGSFHADCHSFRGRNACDCFAWRPRYRCLVCDVFVRRGENGRLARHYARGGICIGSGRPIAQRVAAVAALDETTPMTVLYQANTERETNADPRKYEIDRPLRFIGYDEEETRVVPASTFKVGDIVCPVARNACGMGIDVIRESDGVKDMVFPEEVAVVDP